MPLSQPCRAAFLFFAMQIRRSIKINVIDAAQQKELMFFYFLRSKFFHNVILNYKPEKLARLTGVSPNTVRKYISYLIKNEYFIKSGKNLVFKKFKKESGVKIIRIQTRPWTSFNAFKRRVYSQVIKLHQSQQAWCGKIKANYHRNINNSRSKVDFKRLRKFYKKFRVGDGWNEKVFLSSRSLALIFNCSQTKVLKILKDLKRHKFIKMKEVITKTEMSVSEFFTLKRLDLMPKGFFYINNGRVIQHHGVAVGVLV